MVKAKKFIFAERFVGMPKDSNFRLEEETLPELKENEVLIEAIWHGIDPYGRSFSDLMLTGSTMTGGQVSKVIETKNADYPVGSLVYGNFGWRTHTIYDPTAPLQGSDALLPSYKLPSFDGLPESLALGHLGMPGVTAYFGLLEICQPKAGETVVVSGAAGAVGNIVGQIAKLKGCTVIGIAGSDHKCEWLKKDLGFDYSINYKTEPIDETLKKYAPNGVDCYFDNVGGEMSSTVINQMNEFGRISVCGAISLYNLSPSEYPKVPILQPALVFKQLSMQGFIVTRWADRWPEGIEQLKKWTLEGKLKYQETTWEGFEKLPEAFFSLFQSGNGNVGKVILKP